MDTIYNPLYTLNKPDFFHCSHQSNACHFELQPWPTGKYVTTSTHGKVAESGTELLLMFSKNTGKKKTRHTKTPPQKKKKNTKPPEFIQTKNLLNTHEKPAKPDLVGRSQSTQRYVTNGCAEPGLRCFWSGGILEMNERLGKVEERLGQLPSLKLT